MKTMMQKTLLALTLLLPLCLGAVDTREFIVTGNATVPIKATIADVKIAIDIEGNTAGNVQQAIADRLKPTLEQIRALQVENLQSSVVNVYSTINPSTSTTGYRGRIDISFSTSIEKATTIIEKAFKAGANQLVSLSFRPEDKAIAVARLNALQNACENAILEAKTVMETLGVSTSKISYVKIEPFKAVSETQTISQLTPPTTEEIIQQEQKIPATVVIKFDLKE